MESNEILLLTGEEVIQVLERQEAQVLEVVREAYKAHASGLTAMPPDSYLRFPGKEKERIISKAAYLGADFDVAGLKWIASFPGNLAKGMERASATLILNSIETGRPTAIMESSVISAVRTAASAAIGAQQLWQGERVKAVGLVGCGLINYEILRFLLAVFPAVEVVHIYDLSEERAAQFCTRASRLKEGLQCEVQRSLGSALSLAPIMSFATTAVVPHLDNLNGHQKDAVLLHISLRDLTAEVILQGDNVVDDIDKVCSNNTSVHLAEQQAGNRNFIRATIGDMLNGEAERQDASKPFAIYSPFGLGILDMAVADLVKRLAQKQNVGTVLDGFFPRPWSER